MQSRSTLIGKVLGFSVIQLSMTHLLMSLTGTSFMWSQAAGAHNTKISMVTATSAVILSKESFLRSSDTTLLTPSGALLGVKNTGVNELTLSCYCLVDLSNNGWRWVTRYSVQS